MTTSIQKVALLGAEGNLGPSILSALEAANFTITVLSRQSSKTKKTFPNQVIIPDGFAVEDLVEPLRGHDAAIICIRSENTGLQLRFADACVEAGVRRLIPADFGSVDSSSPLTQELVPLYVQKTLVRNHLITLSSTNKTFTWTSLVCGHFFDWSLPFLHINLPHHTIDILDSGDQKWSTSTLSQIGLATANILRNPSLTENRIVYVQSFCVSQNQVCEAFEKATGVEWTKRKFEGESFKVEEKRKADEGDVEARENLVWYLGAVDADWRGKEGFAMRELGLEEEDLGEVVRGIVENSRVVA